MKKTSLALTLSVVLFSIQLFGAQPQHNTYRNTTFGYSIDYPVTLLPKGESGIKDGQRFVAADQSAELAVWGENNTLDQSLAQKYNDALNWKGRAITYKKLDSNFYVISGKQDDKIFYQKTIKGKTNAYLTFILKYAEAKRTTYDPAISTIGNSFTAVPVGAWTPVEQPAERIPHDAAAVIDRFTNCNHFAGEFNGDQSEHDKQVNKTMRELGCSKIEADVATIRKKYHDNKAIAAALDHASDL